MHTRTGGKERKLGGGKDEKKLSGGTHHVLSKLMSSSARDNFLA